MRSGTKETLAVRIAAAERSHDFIAHLVTTRTDGRADGGQQIVGPRAKNPHHLPHGFLHCTRQRSAPPGVNGGHGALPGIRKEYWHAVCSPDREQYAGFLSEQRVSRRRRGARAWGIGVTGGAIFELPSLPPHDLVD